jgi:autotransporter adhesin
MVVTSELARNTVGGSGTVEKAVDLNQDISEQQGANFNLKPLLLAVLTTMGSSLSWAGYVCKGADGVGALFDLGSTAAGADAFSCGMYNRASGDASSALGVVNAASGEKSLATGTNNLAQGQGATAVGGASGVSYYRSTNDGTKLLSVNDIAVTATTLNTNSITAINGVAVTATDVVNFERGLQRGGSVAFGQNSMTVGSQNLAIGDRSSAVGYNNSATGYASNAFGKENYATADYSSAFGVNNASRGAGSNAVGFSNAVFGDNSNTIGTANTVDGITSNAIGVNNTTRADYSNALGSDNTADGERSLAVGSAGYAYGAGSSAIGGSAKSGIVQAAPNEGGHILSKSGRDYVYDANGKLLSIGGIPVTVDANNTIQKIGGSYFLTTASIDSFNAAVSDGGSIAIGKQATAVGARSSAVGDHSVAIGLGSLSLSDDSIALGSSAIADRDTALSVGKTGFERQIIHVKAATQDTDAVNLSQITPIATAFGGGASYVGGVFTAPTYRIQNQNYIDVGSAFNAVDNKLTTLQNGNGAGVAGKSAYQSAVDAGFQGNEVQWVASLKGDKGDAGAQGFQGVKGDKGDQGLPGAKGDKGDSIFGNDNGVAVKGDKGDQGLQGLKGDKGDQGLQGLNGDKGDQGLQGLKGDQGFSAYQVAANNGFVGTEQQWLDSLAGSGENNPYVSTQSNAAKVKAHAQATGEDAIAIGAGAKAQGTQSISIGVGNNVTGNNSGAIGDPNIVSGNGSYVVGNNNTISGDNSFVLGNNVNTSAQNTVVLGNDSASNRDNTVSVGATNKERQIIHVANATQATDAVNLRQMQSANSQTLSDAKVYTDQGNAATLNSAQSYTDSRVNQLNQNFQEFKQDTNAAIASSLAVAGLPQPIQAGNSLVTAAVGGWNGEQAFAIGVSGVTDNNKIIYKAAGTTNTQGDFGGSIGVGWNWK